MALASPHLRTIYGSAAPEDVDDGIIIIDAHAQRIVTIVDAWVRSTGTADTCTSIDITDGTTVAVAFGVDALSDGVIVRAGDTNTTATSLGAALAQDTPIQIKTTGSDIGTATAIEYCVHYKIESTHA